MFPDILKDSTRRPSTSTLSFCIYRKQHLLSMLLFFVFFWGGVWKREKECSDSTKQFNEGSYNILQEFENLLNSRFNSLGRFIVCINTHVFMCEHTTCTLEAAPCSSSERLSSPNLTLPQRQTKPPL